METQVQPPEYIEATSTKDMTAIADSEPGTLSKPANANQSDNQVSEFGRKISEFLERSPKYVARFFQEYQLPVISFAVLVALFTGLRIVLAITDAINDIPLVSPFFELIGFGYVIWFVSRYFLKASTRQELAGEIDMVKKQIADENAS